MRVTVLGVLFFTASMNVLADDTVPLMMSTQTPATKDNGWTVMPLFTVGQTVGDYAPPGVLDGLGAIRLDDKTVRIFANHELQPDKAYLYSLNNGTRLSGARISYFDVSIKDLSVTHAGLAYDTIYDRDGHPLVNDKPLNDGGLNRLCSARSVEAGQYNFEDTIFFTGEEQNNGTEWALDVKSRHLWAFPAMGHGAWENVSPIQTSDKDVVALVAGDDRQASPMYLYLGKKNAVGDHSFLDRNGLKQGQLYCWHADNGDQTPQQFNGVGSARDGYFIPLTVRDKDSYIEAKALRNQAREKGCFTFSRPEDVHEDPNQPTRVAYASTGRGKLFSKDNWGTLYIADFDLKTLHKPRATIRIVHDADSLTQPDMGIRSPDNVTWGRDGYIYVQEDRSTHPKELFGSQSGVRGSVWQVNPETGEYVRIGEINRDARYPHDTTDAQYDKQKNSDIGRWESSGILDVSALFDAPKGETWLIGTVQAHSLADGAIKRQGLAEGGQLFLMRK